MTSCHNSPNWNSACAKNSTRWQSNRPRRASRMAELNFTIHDRGLQYVGAARIDGPLVVIERVRDVGFDEVVEILDPEGRPRVGRVLDVSEEQTVIQVLEGTTGLSNQ